MDFRICWTHCTAGPKRGCLRLIMTNLKLCTFERVRRREHNLNSHMVIPHLTSCICIDTWDWTCMNTWTSQKALSVWPQPQAELWAQWLTNTIRPTGWIILLTRNSMTPWCPQSWTTVVRSGVSMMYGDMAWIPPEIRQKSAMVRYWIRLTRMPDTRLARRVFNWDHGRARRGTWCHDIKQIFEACDLGEAYQEKSRDRWLIDKIKNELYQNDCNRRRDDMQYMSRMAIYRQLNETTTPNITGPARHVSMNLKRAQRSVISKLRSVTLPLAIETGRYRQTPVPQRLCKQCDLNAVEHEQHFLFQCPRYDIIRHNRMGELDDIDSCFRSDTSIRNLSLYILDCLKLRVWSTAIIDSLYCLHIRQISVVNKILTCSYDDRTYTGGVTRSILSIIDDVTIRTAGPFDSYHQPILWLWVCIVYTPIAGLVIPALIPTTLGLRW